MGISNLLPQLKSITKTTTLHAYKGKTVAVDGYVWLHRGAYSCSQELCLGQDTDRYVGYFMERVGLLIKCGIIPYIVFDGGYLPMKKLKEDERRLSREKHREAGLAYLKANKLDLARQSFVKAVDVSPSMAHRVIQRLQETGVKYMVAPYEADAQMAYLVRTGAVDAVISEDSDCLPYGCHHVLFKMDAPGNVEVIQAAHLALNTTLSFVGFTDDMFLDMCILSGCDYVASIPGLGVKKSHGLMLRYGSYQKVVRALRLEGKLPITKTYEADVARARLTFRHQRVYDPVSQTLTHVTPLPASLDGQDTDFLGPVISTELARGIAEGHIDPITGKPFLLHPAVTLATPSKALEFPADDADAAPLLHTPPTSHVQDRPGKENAFTRLLQAGSLMPRSTTSKRKLPASAIAAAASTKRRPALHPVTQPHANVTNTLFQPRSRYFFGTPPSPAPEPVAAPSIKPCMSSRPLKSAGLEEAHPPSLSTVPSQLDPGITSSQESRQDAMTAARPRASPPTTATPTTIAAFSRFRFHQQT